MKSEKETDLSLTIGEPFVSRSGSTSIHQRCRRHANVSPDSRKRLAELPPEAPGGIKAGRRPVAFDGKLIIDAEAGNHAYALAYLPAGNYRFADKYGYCTGLGSSDGSFTLDSETVKAEAAGTDITVLNAAEAGGRIGSFPLEIYLFRGKRSADNFIF